MCVPINSFSILPQCDGGSEQLRGPGGQALWTAFMEHRTGKWGLCAWSCVFLSLCGAFDDSWSKGCFVTEGSFLWCCLRDQQCRVSLTWTFWNPVILGICFVLVLGKVSELPPYRRQVVGVGHGWTKNPLTPAQFHTHQFYIIEGNCAEAPTVIWSFWFWLPWHHFVQLVWLTVYVKKAEALSCVGSWDGRNPGKVRIGSLVNKVGTSVLEWEVSCPERAFWESIAPILGHLCTVSWTPRSSPKSSFCLESDYDSHLHLFRRMNSQPWHTALQCVYVAAGVLIQEGPLMVVWGLWLGNYKLLLEHLPGSGSVLNCICLVDMYRYAYVLY